MNTALTWHDDTQILGVRVRVHLFDADAADARDDEAGRLLPILCGARLQRLGQPGARQSHAVGELRAQPDAVFRHGNGLICLSHKGGDARPRGHDNWRGQFRVDAMLQSRACAMAVAGQRQSPTAAMLRERGALYQFDPSSTVLECMATHIGDARRYWREPHCVSPAQLASFCESKLRAMPGVRDGSLQGHASA